MAPKWREWAQRRTKRVRRTVLARVRMGPVWGTKAYRAYRGNRYDSGVRHFTVR
jgi:hypothetical protein